MALPLERYKDRKRRALHYKERWEGRLEYRRRKLREWRSATKSDERDARIAHWEDRVSEAKRKVEYHDKAAQRADWYLHHHYIAGTHFTWEEALAKSGYRSIDALPAEVRSGVMRHARAMEDLRKAINAARKQHGLAPTGIEILSWVRSRKHNEEIGGAENSRHMAGDACDISREEVARLCPWGGFDRLAERIFAKDGFGQYPSGARHVDSRGTRARWTSF